LRRGAGGTAAIGPAPRSRSSISRARRDSNTEALCGHSFSASSISMINKSLEEGLKAFAERRLNESYPYMILDARCEKVGEAGAIVSQAVLVAVAVDESVTGRNRSPRGTIGQGRAILYTDPSPEGPRPPEPAHVFTQPAIDVRQAPIVPSEHNAGGASNGDCTIRNP
jgi:hypothetical protein